METPLTHADTSQAPPPPPAANTQLPIPPLLALKLVLAALFWGGTFIAGKVLAQSIPLMTAAFGRFLIASALLVWISYKIERGLPRLNRQQMLGTALLGLTGIFLYNIFFFGALSHIPAGRTALFVSLSPITTALAAALFMGERLGTKRWIGIVTALFGAAIVITRGDLAGTVHDIGQSVGLGEILMTCAVIAWTVYTLISRKVLTSLSPIAATTYSTLWGTLFLGIGAIGQLDSLDAASFTWQVWVSIFYLGAFGTVAAFVWYYQGIRAVGPSRTIIFNNLVPVFGVLLSALLLGEPILMSMLLGGAISVAGVLLVNSK
ncbi:putative DMT superfamily transporter inner membrane protein [Neisseria animaloris]|uniref:DMT family transporter n=1 Tax=Neisseria animaloris TaxID=326522 RepID=UPI000A1900EC|nr:DMT family transporter [Neisseria animaloris]OSI08203.1 EamA family transporter [Neisseria animaloris]VEH86578.1 putative DMT superfamily transporter inner membrane protein [Neisseria animaloris]